MALPVQAARWSGPTGSALPARITRNLSRDLAVVQGRSVVDIARIDAAVARREAVADGVTSIAARAMQHVAVVSQAEQQMALATPHASGRLAAIADAHALAMTGIVMDTARALGRLG